MNFTPVVGNAICKKETRGLSQAISQSNHHVPYDKNQKKDPISHPFQLVHNINSVTILNIQICPVSNSRIS